MYDIFIFRGHGNGDNGATDGVNTEVEVAQKIVDGVVKKLKNKGVSVHTNSYNENNYQNCILKSYKYKYGYSIHMNSASSYASGIECFVPLGEKYLDNEFSMMKQLSALLNIPNRGVKSRNYSTEQTCLRQNGEANVGIDYYKEIREAWQKGISLTILEVGFINSNDDDKILKNLDKVTTIIANVILKDLDKEEITNSEPIQNNNSTGSENLYQVVAGVYKSRENAEKQIQLLKSKGIHAFLQIR